MKRNIKYVNLGEEERLEGDGEVAREEKGMEMEGGV